MMTARHIRSMGWGLLGGILLSLTGRAGEMDLISGDTRTDEFTTPGQTNRYVFHGREGDRIKIRMTEIDESVGPFIKLLDPRGKCFAYADSDCCKYRAAQINVTLRMTGRHILVCKDRQSAIGRFTVSMVCLPGCPLSATDADLGEMTFGETAAGTIDCAGDLDLAHFMVEEPGPFRIRMERIDATLDPAFQLYGPDGRCVASAERRHPRDVCEIDAAPDETGMYTVICQDRYIGTGSYTLSILPLDEEDIIWSNAPSLTSILSLPRKGEEATTPSP